MVSAQQANAIARTGREDAGFDHINRILYSSRSWRNEFAAFKPAKRYLRRRSQSRERLNAWDRNFHDQPGIVYAAERSGFCRRICLGPRGLCVLGRRWRDITARYGTLGSSTVDDGMQHWRAGLKSMGPAKARSMDRKPGAGRRRLARRSHCGLAASQYRCCSIQRRIGVTVALYASYMLFRPSLQYFQPMHQGRNALVGFGGGLIGGLTAMPGALPTIWCDLHGVPKNHQRGLVQPFIAAMQVFALTIMLVRNDLSSKVFVDLALSIPALVAGSMLGIFAFRNASESTFRRIILTVLLFSGVLLAV